MTSRIAPQHSAAIKANQYLSFTAMYSWIVATSVWSIILVEQCQKWWTKVAVSHYTNHDIVVAFNKNGEVCKRFQYQKDIDCSYENLWQNIYQPRRM